MPKRCDWSQANFPQRIEKLKPNTKSSGNSLTDNAATSFDLSKEPDAEQNAGTLVFSDERGF